jgi:predicted nuclease of predicted toxin-antitoxin system
LITEDKDFGALTNRLQKPNHGILLIRLSGLSSVEKSKLVVEAMKQQFETLIDGFSVLTYNNLRIKKKLPE